MSHLSCILSETLVYYKTIFCSEILALAQIITKTFSVTANCLLKNQASIRHIRHSGNWEVQDFLFLGFYFLVKSCVSLIISFYYICLLLLWTCLDGNTCIHPLRIPEKLKFCAIQGNGCTDEAEQLCGAQRTWVCALLHWLALLPLCGTYFPVP